MYSGDIWDKVADFLYFDLYNAFSQAKTYGEECM